LIVDADGLERLRGRVTMVDGGFDPIHDGHVAYFAAAAEFGLPVLCNLAPDSWIRPKHPPLLTQEQRARVIDAFRDVAYTHLAEAATVDVLRLVQPRYYVKGADWRGRLPAEELEACRDGGGEVVFVDTVLGSSTQLLRQVVERAGAGEAVPR